MIDEGLLDVGDGNRIHWETHGEPSGKPVLSVHGGPGSGANDRALLRFDLRRHLVVLFDQRGCGRSVPHASDPATDMSVNTTHHLVADMELLREHLGIDRWLLFGGSWGSTLTLAYAERHPERVSEIVIAGVTTTRPEEIDWLYRGVGRFLPAQWERFREHAGDDDVVAAYARLEGIPGVLIHGRLDLGSPLDTAWRLHRAWPGSELVIVDDAGHTGSDAMRAAIAAAARRFEAAR